ncbi:MAG: tetratricopeptide repeat protein [Candidatus Melainabacteria bacterium]|nr:tetratricopeptide repeat protein [Candidatus Melainabacteria bacterium]
MTSVDERWERLRGTAEKAHSEKRWVDAEQAWLITLEAAEEFAENDRRLALTLEKLAECLFLQSKLTEGAVYCKRILKIYTSVLGPEHVDVSHILGNLAMIYHLRRHFEQAEKYYLQAIEIKARALGSDHPEVTKLRSNYADLLRVSNRTKEADKLKTGASVVTSGGWKTTTGAHEAYEPPSSFAARRPKLPPAPGQIGKAPGKIPPPPPPKAPNGLSREDALAKWNGFKELAEKAFFTGDMKEAEAVWHDALEIAGTFGDSDPKLSYTLESLAEVKFRLQNYKASEGYYRRAYEIKLKALPPVHIALAASANNLARVHYQMCDYDRAEEFALKCVNIYEKLMGQDNPNVACSLHNLATLYHVQRKYREAEPAYKRALEIKKKIFGPDHHETTRLLKSYADLLRSTNRGSEADELDAVAVGLITGTWKTFDIEDNQSLASTDDKCDICAAKLNGAPTCPACGFEVSIGVI